MTPIDTSLLRIYYQPMIDKISPDKIYTPKETRDFLKISDSTMKRMLKDGIIRAYKVSGQYRIWGIEILRLTSPGFRHKFYRFYMKIRNKIKRVIRAW